MANNPKQVSLSEKDYLAIFDINARCLQCQTMEDIQQLALSLILPLLKADHMGVAFMDRDIGHQLLKGQKLVMGASLLPEYDGEEGHDRDKEIMEAVVYFKSLNKTLMETYRPVIAYDVDIPREELKKELNQFFRDHPQYNRDQFFYLNNLASILAVIDPPDWNMGVGFNRFYEDAEAWTSREVRIAELIRSHLLQSIKNIAVNQELKKYKTLADALADTPTPIALVDNFHRLIYQNEAFEKLLSSSLGNKIDPKLIALIEGERRKWENEKASSHDFPEKALSYVQLESMVYRFVSSQVEIPTGDPDCQLVRLKPVVDPYTRLNLSLQEKGLTTREIEIAYLVRDNMDDREIADRLFISLHTVRTHFKSIYRKIDISSRAKLVSFLHS